MGRSVIHALANWMLVHCHYLKCACTRSLRLHLRWSYKLRVQAHYTIFQVFAKHNYLLSWWKDGRNFGRSREVYALEFNLLYLELALEKSCLSKFILESHPLIKLFTFQIELKKWLEHLVLLSQSLSRKWRCFASILWMLTFERLLENVQRRRGSEGLEKIGT